MEFDIDINHPLNRIRATNLAEREMLDDTLLQAKLSYKRTETLENIHGEIYGGNDFSATKDGSIVTIPFFMSDVRRASYYLRMVLDANAVKNGCLPLHAAASINDGFTQFIFAKTGKGKSFTLNTLLSHNPGIIPIGDDHIIIGDGKISGNRIMRIRNRDGEDKNYSVLHGGKVSPLGDYEVVLIDVTAKEECYRIGGASLIEKAVAEKAVLKYLSKRPPEPELEKIYNNIVSDEILKKYHTRFDKFMNGARIVHRLSGGQNHILEKLAK